MARNQTLAATGTLRTATAAGTPIQVTPGATLGAVLSVTKIASTNETAAIDSGGATAGTFTLDFDSEVTDDIAFDATAAEVQAALEALANIAEGDITVAGTTVDADDIVVTFTGNYAGTNVTDLDVGTDSTTGGTGVAVNVTDPGTPTSPTLDVSLEWSNDGTIFATPASADTFAQVTTSAATEAKTFTAKARYCRARWTIGGTNPGYVFSLTAAHQP